MSIAHDRIWRLTLRTPQSLTLEELRELMFSDDEGAPGSPFQLVRILDRPLVYDGALTHIVPMQFHVIGTLEREGHIFESGIPIDGGTETSICVSIGSRPGGAARIEWEQQIRMLERAVREASDVVNVKTLVTTASAARNRKIRVIDKERRTSEVNSSNYCYHTADPVANSKALAILYAQPMEI